MHKRLIFFFATFVAVFAVYNHQVYAQAKNNTVEIISLHLPDSVVFKLAEGVRVTSGTVSVYLVSGAKNIKANELVANPVNISLDSKGGMIATYIDETVFRAKNFKPGFRAQKIKFVVDKKNFLYDIAKSKWE